MHGKNLRVYKTANVHFVTINIVISIRCKYNESSRALYKYLDTFLKFMFEKYLLDLALSLVQFQLLFIYLSTNTTFKLFKTLNKNESV